MGRLNEWKVVRVHNLLNMVVCMVFVMYEERGVNLHSIQLVQEPYVINKNVHLIPQREVWRTTSDLYYSVFFFVPCCRLRVTSTGFP